MHVRDDVRDQLIFGHLELVSKIASKLRVAAQRARIDLDDVIQEGHVALIEAAGRFDPSRTERAAFASFAWKRIRGQMLDALRQARELTGLDLDELPAKRLPAMVPLFPIGSFVPASPCAHRRKIPSGSLLVCAVCHQAGLDGHPLLARDPRTDPAPEPAAPPVDLDQRKPETRRQKRAKRFGLTERDAAALERRWEHDRAVPDRPKAG